MSLLRLAHDSDRDETHSSLTEAHVGGAAVLKELNNNSLANSKLYPSVSHLLCSSISNISYSPHDALVLIFWH